jgi:hypothetical protein
LARRGRKGTEGGESPTDLGLNQSGSDSVEAVLGGVYLLLETEGSEVKVAELGIGGTVTGQVSDEPPIIEASGGAEDLGPEVGLRVANSGEPNGEWLRDVLGSEAGLGVELLEVDGVIRLPHGPLDEGGLSGAQADVARLDLVLARCERDAEVGNAATILNEALRALWRGGRCAAVVKLRVAILRIVTGLERVMELFLVRGVAYDVLVGQGVKPILLVRVGLGNCLDDLTTADEVKVGVRDDGEG